MANAKDVIKSAIEFLTKIRDEEEVNIKFKKKDGTTRIMLATLSMDKVPKELKPKSVNLPKILKLLNSNGILHVFDLDKKEWRSVNYQTVEWLETTVDNKKKRYMISR